MIRGVLFSLALSVLLIYAVLRLQSVYVEGIPERVTRVDVYADHITYRTGTYYSATQLAIGLKAAQDPPQVLALHDCGQNEALESVIEVLREQGLTNFEIELPEDC